MSITFKYFINELASHKLILFGEVHGTNEIPNEMRKIINGLIPFGLKQVLFEIPKSEQHYHNNYVDSGKLADLRAIPFFNNPIRDGRNCFFI